MNKEISNILNILTWLKNKNLLLSKIIFKYKGIYQKKIICSI